MHFSTKTSGIVFFSSNTCLQIKALTGSISVDPSLCVMGISDSRHLLQQRLNTKAHKQCSKIKHAFPHITVTPTYILWTEMILMTYKPCPLFSWGGHCCTNCFHCFQRASTPAELSSRESNKLLYFRSLVHKQARSRNDSAEKHLFWGGYTCGGKKCIPVFLLGRNDLWFSPHRVMSRTQNLPMLSEQTWTK